jgi:hypothetical protein
VPLDVVLATVVLLAVYGAAHRVLAGHHRVAPAKDIPLDEIGITWAQQKYFHPTLSTCFRVLGPTIAGFITFQSASSAITCVLANLILRLGFDAQLNMATMRTR